MVRKSWKNTHNLWAKSSWSVINRDTLIIFVASAPLISSTNFLHRMSCQVTKLFKTFPLFASQNVPVPRCVDTPIHSICHFLPFAYFTASPTTESFGWLNKKWWQNLAKFDGDKNGDKNDLAQGIFYSNPILYFPKDHLDLFPKHPSQVLRFLFLC